jgi:hypothetical protein
MSHGIRSLSLLLLSVMAAACAPPAARQPVVPETAPEQTPPKPPAVDLSGGWATGDANEPPNGPVRQQPSCAYNPAVWIIQQTGNALRAWAFPESYNQGIARREPLARISPDSGTISGNDVRIAGDGSHIVARYDSVSGHLRGTRNDRPFWAARQIIIREACPGIP